MTATTPPPPPTPPPTPVPDPGERLALAVGEYLEAVARLAALEPTMLQRLNCHGDEAALQRAKQAAAAVRESLRGLRRTYAETRGGEPAAVAERSAAAPAPERRGCVAAQPYPLWRRHRV